MSRARNRHTASLVATLLVAAALLSGCETALHVIAFAGGEDLVWPLPPSAARLHYDGSIDIAHGMPPALRAAAGVDAPSLTRVPLRVAARGTLLAIVDRERGTVQLNDRALAQTLILKTEDGRPLLGARDVALDGLRRVYVIEGGSNRIGVYDDSGRLLHRFGMDRQWRRPARLAIDVLGNRLYVADDFLNQVFVFSLDGAYLLTIGRHGRDESMFNGLADIAVDPAGNLVTVETTMRRVQMFLFNGQWKRTIALANGPYALVEPVAVTFEEDGTAYVADRYREAIVIFDREWRPLMTLGGLGRGPARFSGLIDIEFDPRERRLYTCETGFPRIQMFRRSEAPWQPFP